MRAAIRLAEMMRLLICQLLRLSDRERCGAARNINSPRAVYRLSGFGLSRKLIGLPCVWPRGRVIEGRGLLPHRSGRRLHEEELGAAKAAEIALRRIQIPAILALVHDY